MKEWCNDDALPPRRAPCASHLVQAGASIYVVGKILGHTNPNTTAI